MSRIATPILSRRRVLALMASASALAAPMARAQTPGFQAIILSDLHSAYERMGQVLAAIDAHVAAASLPQIVLINGDVFELGNVVATRSAGEIDWLFLEEVAKRAPVVLNIGNHEPDFDNDPANFVARAEALGITVVSNIRDTRTGELYAPEGARIEIGGHLVKIAALGTDAMFTYPRDTRELIQVPSPVEWATQELPPRLAGPGVNIVLSHAGVVADRAILPLVPDGTLLVGGHDHLVFEHAEGATRYVHTGSWSSLITIATIADEGAAPAIERIAIDADGPSIEPLASRIPAVLAQHLTDEERALVATLPAAMTLGETARFTAATIAALAGAHVGFIGHTSFGTGLPAGAVTTHDFNAALRFDGKLMVAQVDGGMLAGILAICNQDGDIPLAERTGDFLYAAPEIEVDPGEVYVIVCNDWSAMNKGRYFGREDIEFTELPDLRLKPLVAEALARG